MEIKVSPQLEALSAMLLNLGYKGDLTQLLNNCAYSTIRQVLGEVLTQAGFEFKDFLKDQEKDALAEMREILTANVEYFKKLNFLNGGLRF